MQNDALRKLSGVFSYPGSFLNKAKKIKKTCSGSQVHPDVKIDKSSVISPTTGACNRNSSPLSEVTKSAPTTDEENNSSALKNPLKGPFNNLNNNSSCVSPGASKVFTKEELPLVHYPYSVSSLDQFSPQRRVWLQNCLAPHGSGIIGVDGASGAAAAVALNANVLKNKATNKLFDIEWSPQIGNVERTSYPDRSFKDNPGNTAIMNEVFLFDVNEPFQLEMSVTGNPVPTKFGTMAGFSNIQTARLGHLDFNFCLDPMERFVRTYKLRRPHGDDGKGRTDCEMVVMIGLHVLEEPVEDRSWETEALYQGFLTVMARGDRVVSWKRYWAVLEGRALKLYDAEYQLKRDAITVIPLANTSRVQLPDYEKVDVGANGFSVLVNPRVSTSNPNPSTAQNSTIASTHSQTPHTSMNSG
ncbi:hypothetical protein BGW39_011692 [Mortierella sp. 14UC]|nr:hypothetical protein BGW39_011692 [Mortierella sp. 14UC]